MASLSEEDRANLVAYLDGELDEEATQLLEARLSQDPVARAELESLKQVYGLLDYLPRPEPSVNFTHRTLERLSMPHVARTTGKMPVPERGYGKMRWAGAIGVALCFLLGWYASRFVWSIPKVEESPRPPAIKADPERDWLAQQPRAIRDKVAALPEKDRLAFLEEEKKRERKSKEEWLIASRFWVELQKGAPLPAQLSDFPEYVETYVRDYLRHFLSKEELARLEQAQGQWPLYPITLVELADKHPPALPGPRGHQRFDELPLPVQKLFKGKVPASKILKGAEGNWPGFARVLTQIAETRGIHFPNELWPYSYKGLNPEMKEFVDKLMTHVLTDEQKHHLLNKTPNRWPEYPRAVQELAQVHGLEPPWFVLPGPRDLWEKYRLRKERP